MQKNAVRSMVYAAVFAALIAVCSWIAIPTKPPFTLQTMGVFLAVGLLGGKLGTISVVVYLLLGAIGLPVFAGFNGGIGYMLGTTGGYLIGFAVSAALMWALEKFWSKGGWRFFLAMVAGLAACYVFGTAWFLVVYARTTGPIGLGTALGWCVLPFLIPDCVKMLVVMLLQKRLKPFIKL